MRKIAPKLAESELIFPTDDMLSKVQISRDLTDDEEQRYTSSYNEAIGLA